MKLLKNKLANYSAGKILDIGTGPGKFISTLIDSFADYDEAIGIDVDQKAIEDARKKFNNNQRVSFILNNSDKLPFPDDYFDTVSLSNTLHHLANYDEMIAEMLRVLKPGGMIIINEMFSDNQNDIQLSHVLYHHLKSDIETALGEYHRKTYTKQELIDIISKTKINIIDAFEDKEEKVDYKVKEELDLFAQKCDNDVAKALNHPKYEEFKARGIDFKKRLYEKGYQRATQLVILGIK